MTEMQQRALIHKYIWAKIAFNAAIVLLYAWLGGVAIEQLYAHDDKFTVILFAACLPINLYMVIDHFTTLRAWVIVFQRRLREEENG